MLRVGLPFLAAHVPGDSRTSPGRHGRITHSWRSAHKKLTQQQQPHNPPAALATMLPSLALASISRTVRTFTYRAENVVPLTRLRYAGRAALQNEQHPFWVIGKYHTSRVRRATTQLHLLCCQPRATRALASWEPTAATRKSLNFFSSSKRLVGKRWYLHAGDHEAKHKYSNSVRPSPSACNSLAGQRIAPRWPRRKPSPFKWLPARFAGPASLCFDRQSPPRKADRVSFGGALEG